MFQNALIRAPQLQETEEQKRLREQQIQVLQDSKVHALKQFLSQPINALEMPTEEEKVQSILERIKNAQIKQ